MDCTHLSNAAGYIKRAINLEKSGKNQQASAEYMEAVAAYLVVLQGEQFNSSDRAYIYSQLTTYTIRARDLLQLELVEASTNEMNDDRSGCAPKNSKSDQTNGNTSFDMLESAVVSAKAEVKWEDVIGLEDAKAPMQEAVIIPMLFPTSPQAKYGHKGLLLFGPGGVGKTQLCKALAHEANDATFIVVRPDMLLSKWVGESEKLVRELFQMARQRKPSILFFDEVDSFCASRTDESDGSRRFKNSLLCEMDGMEDMDGVFVIGATNQPFAIDASFLRRFPRRVYVPLPNFKAREEIIKSKLQPYKFKIPKADITALAKKTEGYSGSDLQSLVTEAGLGPFRDITASKSWREVSTCDFSNIRPVLVADFKLALKKCTPANSQALVSKLEQWNLENGVAAHVDPTMLNKSPSAWQTFKDVFGISI